MVGVGIGISAAYNDGIRPLNKYLAHKEVAHCPADSGDPRMDISVPYQLNCWDAYGTSYQIAWQATVFAIRYVTADSTSI